MISIILIGIIVLLLLYIIAYGYYVYYNSINYKYIRYKLYKSSNFKHMYIITTVNGTRLKLLLDTGSEYSYINKRVLSKLKQSLTIQTIKQEEQLGIRGISSELFIPVNSKAIVRTNFNRYLCTDSTFFITDLGTVDGIIGLDWLHQYNAHINIPKNKLYISKAMIKRYDIRSNKSKRVIF